MLLWNWILSFQLLVHSAQHKGLIESTTNVWHKSDGFNNEEKKILDELWGRAKQSNCCYKHKQLGQSVKHIPPPHSPTPNWENEDMEARVSCPQKSLSLSPFQKVSWMLLKITFCSQNLEFIMHLPRKRKILLVASHPHQDEPNAMPSFNFT